MESDYPFIQLPLDYFKIKYGNEWKHEFENGDDLYYSTAIVDKYEFSVFKKQITSANIIEFIAGTTGYQGGDSGHGCRTMIRIKDLASTDIRVKELFDSSGNVDGVEIVFGGDYELSNLIKGLNFIENVLKVNRHNGSLYEGDEPLD